MGSVSPRRHLGIRREELTSLSARATLKRVLRRRRTTAVAFGIALAATGARGDPLTYDVEYHVDPSCPDLSGLVARISERLGNADHAPGHAEVRFVVRIAGRGPEWHGQLELPSDGRVREVWGASCASVADALALIIAVTLEPAAVLDLPDADVSEPRKTSSRTDRRDEVDTPDAAATAEASPVGLLGTAGVLASGIAPSPLYGLRVFGELAPKGRMGSAFRIGFSRQSSGVAEVGSGAARFSLTTASVEACPGVADAAGLLLSGCGVVEGGALHAEGVPHGGVTEAHSVTRPWFELGISTRVSWVIADILRVELSGAVTHPVTRRAYVFDNPREVVQEPALLVGRAGLGLAGELR